MIDTDYQGSLEIGVGGEGGGNKINFSTIKARKYEQTGSMEGVPILETQPNVNINLDYYYFHGSSFYIYFNPFSPFSPKCIKLISNRNNNSLPGYHNARNVPSVQSIVAQNYSSFVLIQLAI